MDIVNLEYDFYNSSFNLGDNIIKIYAHPGEELYHHLEKTKLIFNKLINEKIIKQYYEFFLERKFITIEYHEFLGILNTMIYFHDISKISFNFQIKRLEIDDIKNILEENDKKNILSMMESNHSFLSSLLCLSTFFEKFDLKKNKILILLVYVIYGHHTSIKNVQSEYEFIHNLTHDEKLKCNLQLFLSYLDEPILDRKKFKNFYKLQKNLSNFLKETHDNSTELTSQISFFYSYIYSLLVKSDVIASSYYDEDISYVKAHVLDWGKKINHNILSNMNEGFNRSLDNFKNQKYNKLNSLREEMMNGSSAKLQYSLNNNHSKIFYLNLPTGGGKTNTSMKLALDILKNTDVNKIIYAMPFINIIDQNFDVIKNTFFKGTNEYESIRKIYSASESIFKGKSDDDKSEILLKDDFFDYPIICTTFVTFFNSILKNKKKYKYALSSLANSVIILDEIQSLPLKNWTSLYYLINEISNNYNIYFIIMSATMPSFDSLKINNEEEFLYNTIHLIENPEKYFSHELFKRTKIYKPIEEIEIGLENELKDNFYNYFNKVLSENFNNGYTKCLIVVNTVKTSKFIYQQLIQYMENNQFNFDFEIDLLNSTILSSERKRIIHKINNKSSINHNYILVSTQSVEAGVDVSFDFVIRDLAILDSIEQVRGRCNRSREINERLGFEDQKGRVYLIKLKRNNKYDYLRIYPNNEEYEIRFKETMKILENNLDYTYRDILKYYKEVSKRINLDQGEKNRNLIRNDAKNIEFWNRCIYSKIQDKISGIHLINEKFENYSFFVSTNQIIYINNLDYGDCLNFGNDIGNMGIVDLETILTSLFVCSFTIENMSITDLEELGDDFEKQCIFSINELIYLKEKSDKYKEEHNLKIINNNEVDGSEVLRLYEIIRNELKDDITQRKILQKEFSSILNKFIFQSLVFDFGKLRNLFNLKEFGFFHIIDSDYIGESPNDLYSLKTGFNFDYFDDCHDFEIL
jgi:CRISPR-associated endonuclease/helicase Cas3